MSSNNEEEFSVKSLKKERKEENKKIYKNYKRIKKEKGYTDKEAVINIIKQHRAIHSRLKRVEELWEKDKVEKRAVIKYLEQFCIQQCEC